MGRPWTETTNQAKFYYLVLPSVTTRVEDFVVCGEEHFILFNTKRFISKDLVGLTWSVHCIENSTKEQSGRNYTLNPRTPASPPARQFLRNLRCNMFGLEGRTRRVRGRGRWRVQWRLSTVAGLPPDNVLHGWGVDTEPCLHVGGDRDGDVAGSKSGQRDTGQYCPVRTTWYVCLGPPIHIS